MRRRTENGKDSDPYRLLVQVVVEPCRWILTVESTGDCWFVPSLLPKNRDRKSFLVPLHDFVLPNKRIFFFCLLSHFPRPRFFFFFFSYW